MAALLEVRGLTVDLPTQAGWVKPVNDVSLSLSEGETLGVVGESGSGKTILALALMGLEPPGCAFAPHCPYRRNECDAAVPEMRAASPAHRARCILIP